MSSQIEKTKPLINNKSSLKQQSNLYFGSFQVSFEEFATNICNAIITSSLLYLGKYKSYWCLTLPWICHVGWSFAFKQIPNALELFKSLIDLPGIIGPISISLYGLILCEEIAIYIQVNLISFSMLFDNSYSRTAWSELIFCIKNCIYSLLNTPNQSNDLTTTDEQIEIIQEHNDQYCSIECIASSPSSVEQAEKQTKRSSSSFQQRVNENSHSRVNKSEIINNKLERKTSRAREMCINIFKKHKNNDDEIYEKSTLNKTRQTISNSDPYCSIECKGNVSEDNIQEEKFPKRNYFEEEKQTKRYSSGNENSHRRVKKRSISNESINKEKMDEDINNQPLVSNNDKNSMNKQVSYNFEKNNMEQTSSNKENDKNKKLILDQNKIKPTSYGNKRNEKENQSFSNENRKENSNLSENKDKLDSFNDFEKTCCRSCREYTREKIKSMNNPETSFKRDINDLNKMNEEAKTINGNTTEISIQCSLEEIFNIKNILSLITDLSNIRECDNISTQYSLSDIEIEIIHNKLEKKPSHAREMFKNIFKKHKNNKEIYEESTLNKTQHTTSNSDHYCSIECKGNVSVDNIQEEKIPKSNSFEEEKQAKRSSSVNENSHRRLKEKIDEHINNQPLVSNNDKNSISKCVSYNFEKNNAEQTSNKDNYINEKLLLDQDKIKPTPYAYKKNEKENQSFSKENRKNSNLSESKDKMDSYNDFETICSIRCGEITSINIPETSFKGDINKMDEEAKTIKANTADISIQCSLEEIFNIKNILSMITNLSNIRECDISTQYSLGDIESEITNNKLEKKPSSAREIFKNIFKKHKNNNKEEINEKNKFYLNNEYNEKVNEHVKKINNQENEKKNENDDDSNLVHVHYILGLEKTEDGPFSRENKIHCQNEKTNDRILQEMNRCSGSHSLSPSTNFTLLDSEKKSIQYSSKGFASTFIPDKHLTLKQQSNKISSLAEQFKFTQRIKNKSSENTESFHSAKSRSSEINIPAPSLGKTKSHEFSCNNGTFKSSSPEKLLKETKTNSLKIKPKSAPASLSKNKFQTENKKEKISQKLKRSVCFAPNESKEQKVINSNKKMRGETSRKNGSPLISKWKDSIQKKETFTEKSTNKQQCLCSSKLLELCNLIKEKLDQLNENQGTHPIKSIDLATLLMSQQSEEDQKKFLESKRKNN